MVKESLAKTYKVNVNEKISQIKKLKSLLDSWEEVEKNIKELDTWGYE